MASGPLTAPEIPSPAESSRPAPSGAGKAPGEPSGAAPGPIDPERPLGDLLVASGALTAQQLSKALRIQSRVEEWRPLGQLLVEMGMVPRARMEEVRRESRKALSVEQILVSRGLLRAEQLAAAERALQGKPQVSPARHLVETGTITERAYLEAYCEKHELPFVDLDVNHVDRSLLVKANLKYLAKVAVLPIAVRQGSLHAAAVQVLPEAVRAELERQYRVPVTLWITESTRISAALAALEAELSGTGGPARSVQYHVVARVSDDNRSAATIVDNLLARAIQQRASDVHFDPSRTGMRVRFRIDGELVRIAEYPNAASAAVISRLKVLAEADIAERRVHQQGRILLKSEGEEIDVRASFYVTVAGENAVLRLLRKTGVLVSLDDLGMSPNAQRSLVQDVLEPATGMVLVTGPTGSGKTTTLYAAVQRMTDESKKVITCEDPVEYLMDGATQCSVADRDGMSFVDSLRTILRQDPDVILVGEIRDKESAEMAVHCALTGHKLLSTLHTEDSVSAVVRLVQMGIEPFLVASTLAAVVAQRLVRRLCPQCRTTHAPSMSEIRALSLGQEDMSAFAFSRGKGCPTCHYTGYRGRVGVYELLLMSDQLRDAILQQRPVHEIRRLAQDAPGFYSLQEDGIAKALGGHTSLAEIIANCPRVLTTKRLRQLQEIYP
jgi:type IV pilus assembly protein PilB